MVPIKTLIQYTDTLLDAASFKDYCPNGLQVEGCMQIKHLVTGVTASQALIEAAVAQQADALLVHHGFFWRGEDPRVRGIKRKRLRLLLENDITLLAYHLPLDAHKTLGNNALLAQAIGAVAEGALNAEGIGNFGHLTQAMSGAQLTHVLDTVLGRRPHWIDTGPVSIERIGWCTGAAQGYIEQAIELGLDAFISGEISEQTVHLAREAGIHYFAAGHHATERFGVSALGEHLAKQFELQHSFVDIDNPV